MRKLRPLSKRSLKQYDGQQPRDLDLLIAPEMQNVEDLLSIDKATDLIFERQKWPLLGGSSGKGWSFFCVTPETRVLTDALEWIPAGALLVGSRLLAFDEVPEGNGRNKGYRGKRKLRGARVVHDGLIERVIYKLTLNDGTTLRCSAEHPWLVQKTPTTGMIWRSTEELAVEVDRGDQWFLPRFLPMWPDLTRDPDVAYLRGIFDGEGHVTISGARTGKPSRGCFRTGVAQNPGVVLDEIKKGLDRLGYTYTAHKNPKSNVINVNLVGGVSDVLSFVGSVRPHRFLDKLRKHIDGGGWLGEMPRAEKLKITAIEKEGLGQVVALETTTHTYFAEGFAAHNSTAQRCPRLFYETYDRVDGVDESIRQVVNGSVPVPLQIGGLYHTLHALYEAGAMVSGSGCVVLPDRKGLIAQTPAEKLLDREGSIALGRLDVWEAPSDAASQLLYELKQMADQEGGPSIDVIAEAERLFDAHTLRWNNSDVEPLAIELFARAKSIGYTCRFDLVARVGDHDVIEPGIYIFERKTAKYIDEAYLEGWAMDGEVLGQILCWKESGLDEIFGKLSGVVMDVVGKGKVPQCRRIVLPPDIPHVARHARWVRMTEAQTMQWRATGVYPQNFGNCYSRYGRCSNWTKCVTEAP